MGGKQVDLALKKVMLSDSASLASQLPCLHSTCLCFSSNYPSLRAERCFSGSITHCKSRVLLMYSFLGDNLKFLAFEEDIMISVVCSSCVEGKSQRNSFLHCFVAVVSFLTLYTGKASRLGSSRVSNFRLYSLPPILPALTGSSSKLAKKEVFSGEQWSLSDSAFLWICAASWRSRGRLKRREGLRRELECVRLGKKSSGSLFLLILMRLVLPLGSLAPRLTNPSQSASSPSNLRTILFSLRAESSQSIRYNYFIQQK